MHPQIRAQSANDSNIPEFWDPNINYFKGETGKKPTTKKPTVGILVYGILTYEFVGNLFLMGTLVGILAEVKIY